MVTVRLVALAVTDYAASEAHTPSLGNAHAGWHRNRARWDGLDYGLCDTISCQIYGGVDNRRPTPTPWSR